MLQCRDSARRQANECSSQVCDVVFIRRRLRPMPSKYDRELGLDRPITRRDFIQGSALAMGGAIVGGSATGTTTGLRFRARCRLVWTRAASATTRGLTAIRRSSFRSRTRYVPALSTGPHWMRTSPERSTTLAVVGAGFSGLSAAHHFRRLYPRGKGDPSRQPSDLRWRGKTKRIRSRWGSPHGTTRLQRFCRPARRPGSRMTISRR